MKFDVENRNERNQDRARFRIKFQIQKRRTSRVILSVVLLKIFTSHDLDSVTRAVIVEHDNKLIYKINTIIS